MCLYGGLQHRRIFPSVLPNRPKKSALLGMDIVMVPLVHIGTNQSLENPHVVRAVAFHIWIGLTTKFQAELTQGGQPSAGRSWSLQAHIAHRDCAGKVFSIILSLLLKLKMERIALCDAKNGLNR